MNGTEMPAANTAYPTFRGVRAAQWIARFAVSPIDAATEITKRYGPLVAFDLSAPWATRSKLAFLASGARSSESVLSRSDDYRAGAVLLKSEPGSALKRLSNGIFSRNDREHRELRKAYAKPQSPKLLTAMRPMLRELVASEVKQWPFNGQVDLVAATEKITRRASIKFLLGDLDERVVFEIADGIERLMKLNNGWRTYVFPFALPGTDYNELLSTAVRLEISIRSLVKQRIASGKRANDILSALIDRAGDDLGEGAINDIVSQVPTIFAASQETCKVTIPWTLLLLCQHPTEYAEVAEWARQHPAETVDVVHQQNSPLVRAIKESMRLLPAIPFVWRVARRHTDIAGHPVPTGTRVLVSQYLTNRDPNIFPEPDRFRPGRWQSINPTHYEFADYSAGARRCIGLHFAEALQSIAITEILRARTLKLVDGQRIDHSVAVTLRPSGPIMAELTAPGDRSERRRIRGTLSEIVAL